MFKVSDQEFHDLVNEALASLPKTHLDKIKNVAILVDFFPSEEQRQKSNLTPNQTLLGLYEGLPLSQRQGNEKLLPDKITLYKVPIEMSVNDFTGLKEQIRHTLWHEVAHYFGLDHDAIAKLE